MNAQEVASYLQSQPPVLRRHTPNCSAAVQLTSPHSHRAVSLQERQMEILREKNEGLEPKPGGPRPPRPRNDRTQQRPHPGNTPAPKWTARVALRGGAGRPAARCSKCSAWPSSSGTWPRAMRIWSGVTQGGDERPPVRRRPARATVGNRAPNSSPEAAARLRNASRWSSSLAGVMRLTPRVPTREAGYKPGAALGCWCSWYRQAAGGLPRGHGHCLPGADRRSGRRRRR
ncbi:hypothetical protein ACU4GD_09155 [Cupriavidus basilensis]